MLTKKCAKCGRELPVTHFHKNKSRTDGLNSYCKDCVTKYPKIKRKKMTKIERGAYELYGIVNKATIKGYLKSLTNQRDRYII
jgi:hypothetical protein